MFVKKIISLMRYKLHYQGKSIQIDIPNPLTYDKLVDAVMVIMGFGNEFIGYSWFTSRTTATSRQ